MGDRSKTVAKFGLGSETAEEDCWPVCTELQAVTTTSNMNQPTLKTSRRTKKRITPMARGFTEDCEDFRILVCDIPWRC